MLFDAVSTPEAETTGLPAVDTAPLEPVPVLGAVSSVEGVVTAVAALDEGDGRVNADVS